jgi:hypothetical protein
LYRKLKSWKIKIKFQHIKGHQDRHRKKLTSNDLLNIRADQLATEGLKLANISHYDTPRLIAKLYINGSVNNAHHSKTLHYVFHSIRVREYYMDKYKWKDQDVDQIWWEVHGKALQTFTPNQRCIIHKFIHNKLPCKKTENLYYKYCPPECYLCKTTIECQIHLIRCSKCNKRIKLWKIMCKQSGII